ncbi:MAG: GlsB/YeaQ/YmgE family stress response membrane protein [Cyanobacteria bacterium P01_D01_bin.50]
MVSILAWIVLGAIAGIIAKLIVPGDQGGGLNIPTIILGIVGAFVGGGLYSFITEGTVVLPVAAGFNFPSIITAVVGAIIVVAIWELVSKLFNK